jgi:hypothetical protein
VYRALEQDLILILIGLSRVNPKLN